jgi:Fic family protein
MNKELDRECKRLERLIKSFKPTFSPVDSVSDVAAMINAPHIDDSLQLEERTKRTIEAIDFLSRPPHQITWFDAKQIHSLMWYELNPNRIRIGELRRHNVRIGSNVMPRHEFLSQLIDRAFPIQASTESSIVSWYRTFEAIHPFADGNGRVGGVIVAVMSKAALGFYLAPHTNNVTVYYSGVDKRFTGC